MTCASSTASPLLPCGISETSASIARFITAMRRRTSRSKLSMSDVFGSLARASCTLVSLVIWIFLPSVGQHQPGQDDCHDHSHHSHELVLSNGKVNRLAVDIKGCPKPVE